MHKKFHQFALQSALFKGRADWYFCYLKSEKIAHVLSRLADAAPAEAASSVHELARSASKLPESIVRFASGELEQGSTLADIFSLLSAVRFASTEGKISSPNALLLVEEYEHMAEKLGLVGHPSPFVSSEDFSVPALSPESNISLPEGATSLKDKNKTKGHLSVGKAGPKGHQSGSEKRPDSKERGERLSLILEVIRKQNGASIKDISAIVKNYSEKTIQREITALIKQGLVRKEGERRWSLYLPVSGI